MDEQHLDWDHRVSLLESADLAHPIRNGFCAATAGPRNIELSPFGPGMLDYLPNRYPQSYFTHVNSVQFIARPVLVTWGCGWAMRPLRHVHQAHIMWHCVHGRDADEWDSLLLNSLY